MAGAGKGNFVWALSVVALALLAGCGQNASLDSDSKALRQKEELWHSDTAAAGAAYQQKNYSEAKKLYQKALDDALELGQEHPAVAASLTNMANFYFVQGDGQQAEALYNRALKLREKVQGLEHQDLAVDLIGLGSAYRMEKKYAQAEECFARAVKIRQKCFAENDLRTAEAKACLAHVYFDDGKYRDAAPLYGDTLAILDKLSRPPVPALLKDYADCLRKAKQNAEAAKIEARYKSLSQAHGKQGNS